MFTDDVKSKDYRTCPDFLAWLATRAPAQPEPHLANGSEPAPADNEADQ